MNDVVTNGPREGRLPISKMPLVQVKNVKDMLMNDQAKQQLQAVAAKHMNPERMMRLMANAIRTTPKLAECTPISLLGAMMQCASLGLEPNTVLGHAYLIPFDETKWDPQKRERVKLGTNVQLIIGYKGYIDLARRSGHITSIAAGIHYSDDETTGGLWEYEEGTESKLRHRAGHQEGEKLHAYAIAKFRDGGHAYVVMPWHKVMKIRDGSQGWKSALATAERYKKPDKPLDIKSPWFTHEDEMAQKTAIRALAKYLPLSTEFRDGLESDGARADFGAFAMNPTAGLDAAPSYDLDGDYTDEGDYGDGGFDPETGETGGAPVIEDRRGADLTIDRQPEKEPARKTTAKTQQRREEPPARQQEPERDQSLALDRTDDRPMEDRPSRTASKDDPKPQTPDLIELIMEADRKMKADLEDGANLQSTLDMFRGRYLNPIKAASQSDYDALIADVTQYAEDLERMNKGR